MPFFVHHGGLVCLLIVLQNSIMILGINPWHDFINLPINELAPIIAKNFLCVDVCLENYSTIFAVKLEENHSILLNQISHFIAELNLFPILLLILYFLCLLEYLHSLFLIIEHLYQVLRIEIVTIDIL